MAFSIYYNMDNPNKAHKTFLCDSEDDVAELPTQTTKSKEYPTGAPTGSIAIVTSDNGALVFILNNAGEWKQM